MPSHLLRYKNSMKYLCAWMVNIQKRWKSLKKEWNWIFHVICTSTYVFVIYTYKVLQNSVQRFYRRYTDWWPGWQTGEPTLYMYLSTCSLGYKYLKQSFHFCYLVPHFNIAPFNDLTSFINMVGSLQRNMIISKWTKTRNRSHTIYYLQI